jgi:hypothetical protein
MWSRSFMSGLSLGNFTATSRPRIYCRPFSLLTGRSIPSKPPFCVCCRTFNWPLIAATLQPSFYLICRLRSTMSTTICFYDGCGHNTVSTATFCIGFGHISAAGLCKDVVVHRGQLALLCCGMPQGSVVSCSCTPPSSFHSSRNTVCEFSSKPTTL